MLFTGGEQRLCEQACFCVPTLFAEAPGGIRPVHSESGARCRLVREASAQQGSARFGDALGPSWELRVPKRRILVIGLLLIN